MSVSALRNFMIFGAAGSGKGTIAAKIVKDFAFKHVSSGDLLRKHIHDGTDLGKKAKGYMDQGQLVPDNIIIGLIQEEVSKKHTITTSTLLDGFPRTLEQAKKLNESFAVDVAINLKVPHEVIMDRMAQRWIHFPSGRTYSYDYKPPKVHGKDDITGEDLQQREDDKPEVVKRRLVHYDEMIQPLLDFYSRPGSTTRVKSFTGTMSDVIYPQIFEYFTKELKLVKV